MLRATAILVLLLAGMAPGAGVRAQDQPANDTAECRKIRADIGLPEKTDDDATADDIKIICHLGYITAQNARTRIPEWVMERLTPELLQGPFGRKGANFKADPAAPDETQARGSDYKKSGFDQGHQAAAADFKSSQQILFDTFFFTNAVPQVGKGFNQDSWRGLESLVQKLAESRPELYVITGPVEQESRAVRIKREADACRNEIVLNPLPRKEMCPQSNENPSASCTDGVHIPAALYKIIYDPGMGRVNAFLMPNIDHRTLRGKQSFLEYVKQFRVGVNSIESLTGLKFFPALPARTQTQLKESCAITLLH